MSRQVIKIKPIEAKPNVTTEEVSASRAVSRPLKRILFVFPPVTRPKDFSSQKVRVSVFFPLGLAYLAAAVEKTGKYEIKILDALIEGDFTTGIPINGGEELRYGLLDQDVAAVIREFAPDVVGVSALFSALEYDMANICALAKEVNPQVVTVVGGAHPGANAAEILEKYSSVDFVCIGEAEESFIEFLDIIQHDEPLSKLDGFGFRVDGKVQVNPKEKFIWDLDTIAYPARHLFNMQKYLDDAAPHATFRQRPFTQMISSRGCPYKCTFCAIENHWGEKQRLRSPENVLGEIDELVNKYGVRELHFEDDNFTFDNDRAMKILDGMIQRKYNLSWNVPSGIAATTLSTELLEKMKESGCYSVSLAIESGNQRVVSKIMRKPISLRTVPALVKKIREIGMDARGFFIIGYPGETKENIRETIDFARKIELDWAYFFAFAPLPHTPIYDVCIEKGYLRKEDFDPIRSFYSAVLKTPEFSPEEVVQLREEAIVDVNFINNANLRKYDVDKAIFSFQEVLKSYPHFDFAHFALGEAYLRKNELQNAIESFNNTLKANPNHAQAQAKLEELQKVH